MHNQRLKKYGSLDLPPTEVRLTRYQRENPDKVREQTKRYRAQNPMKRRAHRKVEVEIRAGRLTGKPCEVCGNQKSQAHHDDYNKPLDLIWLCAGHHMRRHVYLRRNGLDPEVPAAT